MDRKAINLLFLGGAKRVSMARRFKSSAREIGLDCNIFSYEMSQHEAIACEAEVICGLKWSDPMCDSDLRKIIGLKSIDAVIPFVDGAVAVASRLSDVAFVPCGSVESAEAMFDKVTSAHLFEKAGLPVPMTYEPGYPSLRLIAKPRHGSASKGIVEIHSLQQLDEILSKGKDYLVQERIDNRREYTVDCYADVFTGKIITACPRLRIQVVGGEVVKTVTVASQPLVELATESVLRLGLRGAVTVQIIEDMDDGRLLLMEINPRLGGGAVCSVAAGADIPSLIIRQALGMTVESPEWRAGVEIARYPAETVFFN